MVAILAKHDLWSPYLFTPSVIKSWVSADDHSSSVLMTDDGAGLISSWKDRQQALTYTGTTTARPTWSATSFNSAYPGVTFDGSATNLASGAITALPNTTTSGAVCMLVDSTIAVGVAGTGCFYGYGATGSHASRQLERTLNSSAAQLLITDNTTNIRETGTSFFGPTIICALFDSVTLTIRINGAAGTQTATAMAFNTNAGGRSRIGADSATAAATFATGVFCEGMVLSGTITTAQFQQIEGYWAWTKGLTTLLPSDHPYKFSPP